jgi:multidrug efflux pump subunit AcrA (membrane-fusion protein)
MHPATQAASDAAVDEHALTRALASLLDLTRRARAARSEAELGFLLVNDTMQLASYRQAGLWHAVGGIKALSGLVQPEANAPYAQWLRKICRHLAAPNAAARTQPAGAGQAPGPGVVRAFGADDVPDALAREWAEWWPAQAAWIPLPPGDAPVVVSPGADAPPPALAGTGPDAPAGDSRSAIAADGTIALKRVDPPAAGLVLTRDEPWSVAELTLLQEWTGAWWHALLALRRQQRRGWLRPWARSTDGALPSRRAWWRRPFLFTTLVLAAAAFVPVRLSVLAPGELVPVRPVVVRSPLDGVVDVFHVQPNQTVRKGQPLFGFDEALIQSKLDVASQSLTTAVAEYRQTAQQALVDAKARPQLAVLTGRIEEKRAEVAYLREQLGRARVLAPQDGVVLFDDPTEWIGRPVSVGERILRIAATGDVEVEAWLPIGDAITLPTGAPVQLFLNASPLEPVTASLRYLAHDAVQRPDGSWAYRARATLDGPTAHRVGLKGTAKLQGDEVPAVYWVMRRPLATLRSMLGV